MRRWELVESAPVPGRGGWIELHRRGEELSITVEGHSLMSNRMHDSEEALADLACDRIAGRPRPRVLIGGLGMGYTLAAALRRLPADGSAVVAELVPAVVQWNHGPLAHLNGYPLSDPRVTVREADVARILREQPAAYDAVLLDVDNGPEGLTRADNDRLYSDAGLQVTIAALRPRGVLGVWSAAPDRTFARRLTRTGFQVHEATVSSRPGGKGDRHTLWIAQLER